MAEMTTEEQFKAMEAQIASLEKQQKDAQAWGTKNAQEAAELRGQIKQLSSTPAAAPPPQADPYGFLTSEDLEETLRDDPAKAAHLIRQAMATLSGQVSQAFEAQDQMFESRFTEVTGRFDGLNPGLQTHSEQIKALEESGDIPGYKDMPTVAKIAIAERLAAATPEEPEPAPSPAFQRMNPPGSAGGGTSVRNAPAKDVEMKDDPRFAAALTAMGGLISSNSGATVTPTVNGAKHG